MNVSPTSADVQLVPVPFTISEPLVTATVPADVSSTLGRLAYLALSYWTRPSAVVRETVYDSACPTPGSGLKKCEAGRVIGYGKAYAGDPMGGSFSQSRGRSTSAMRVVIEK